MVMVIIAENVVPGQQWEKNASEGDESAKKIGAPPRGADRERGGSSSMLLPSQFPRKKRR